MKKNYLINRLDKKKVFKKRITIASAIIIFLTLLLFMRLFYLQVIKHQYYTNLSRKNEIALMTIPPQRGLIYDRHGNIIAQNKRMYTLTIMPNRIKNLKDTLTKLNQIIPLSPIIEQSLYHQLHNHYETSPIPVKTALSADEVAKFLVNKWQFKAISLQKKLIRDYPYGSLFAHVVGYVGHINTKMAHKLNINNDKHMYFVGKTGIEKYYDTSLRGQMGYEQIETDARGKKIRVIKKKQPIPGNNLYLTIDTHLQAFITKTMANRTGAVVVTTMSGQILALVSTPTFNPNLLVQGINKKQYDDLVYNSAKPLYNRITRGLYAPGSTIKPLLALAALSYHVIDFNYQIFDPGYFKLPGNQHIYHDWKIGGHGWVNVTKAIVQSCDTFFFNLGYHMGIKLIDKVLYDFGFGQPTGIDLPYEASGVRPSPQWKMMTYGKRWYLGDTVNLAIGQGYLLVTPIQLAFATEILANRGQKNRLHLCLASKNQHQLQQPCVSSQLTIPHQMSSMDSNILQDSKAWQTIQDAMHQVISRSGSGWGFGIPRNYTVAAKTGTAQVSSIRFSSNKYTHVPKKLRPDSWVIIFAPYQHPEIALE